MKEKRATPSLGSGTFSICRGSRYVSTPLDALRREHVSGRAKQRIDGVHLVTNQAARDYHRGHLTEAFTKLGKWNDHVGELEAFAAKGSDSIVARRAAPPARRTARRLAAAPTWRGRRGRRHPQACRYQPRPQPMSRPGRLAGARPASRSSACLFDE
jgi:hypothetical protein